MTPDLRFGGVSAQELLEKNAQQLINSILEAIVAGVDIYQELPTDVVQVDVRAVVHENLRGFSEVMQHRSSPSSPMMRAATASAYRRAEEGVPLDMVISAYLVAAHEGWRLVTAEAGPDDVADLRESIDLVLGYLRHILAPVSTAYIEELRGSYAQDFNVRTNLLGALLAGEPAQEAAIQAGIALPATYTVIIAHVPDIPAVDGEPAGQIEASVSQRRRARQLRTATTETLGEGPLMSLDQHGGLILVADRPGQAPPRLDQLVQRLSEAAGVQVMLTIGTAPPEKVCQAVRETRELGIIACASGRSGNIFRLEDLLLEVQLGRPTAATPHLAALLDPLDSNPDLLPTLRLHLANNLDRRATAEAFNVHPNTIDYRIQRIRALTGLDPTATSDSAVLVAALAARVAMPPAPQPD